MTNLTKDNKSNVNEIIDKMILNPKISIRVFKSVITTMRKSSILRKEIEGFTK